MLERCPVSRGQNEEHSGQHCQSYSVLTFLKLENSLHLPSATHSSENQVTLDVLLFKILHYYVNLLILPLALKPKSAAFFSLKSGIA